MKPLKLHHALAFIALLALSAAPTLARDTVAEGSFDRTLKVTGAVDLTVETSAGSINVRTGDASTVHVVGKIRVSSGWRLSDSEAQQKVHSLESNPPIEQNGDTIRIGEIRDEDLRRNVSISYELVVPADTRLRASTGSGSQDLDGVKGPVEATTGSGSLRIAHIGAELRASTGSGSITLDTIQGGVRATTGSGSIRAENVAGGLTGQTGSGNIEYSQSAAGDVDVQTGSGGIDLRGVHGRISARAASGSIHAQGVPTGDWRLYTGSGGVTLELPPDTGFELEASTGSGAVNISPSHELTVSGVISRRELHGKAHGGGPLISVSTASGSIRVE
jgi:DUF4097 and DUF4098 domain-containing protein YvlB